MLNRIWIFVIAIVIFSGCFGDGKSNNDAKNINIQDSTLIVFDNDMHDFGTLSAGEAVACQFGFTNAGDKPLLIREVTAGCGCTNVKYPDKPLLPNEKGIIEVTFNSRGKHGNQRQMVHIISNGSQQPMRLIIRAEVQTLDE